MKRRGFRAGVMCHGDKTMVVEIGNRAMAPRRAVEDPPCGGGGGGTRSHSIIQTDVRMWDGAEEV